MHLGNDGRAERADPDPDAQFALDMRRFVQRPVFCTNFSNGASTGSRKPSLARKTQKTAAPFSAFCASSRSASAFCVKMPCESELALQLRSRGMIESTTRELCQILPVQPLAGAEPACRFAAHRWKRGMSETLFRGVYTMSSQQNFLMTPKPPRRHHAPSGRSFSDHPSEARRRRAATPAGPQQSLQRALRQMSRCHTPSGA